MDAVINDVIKVGSMSVVSQILGGKSLGDRAWQMSTVFTLVGFAVYELFVSHWVKKYEWGNNKELVQDLSKVGTMLVVSRLLNGDSVMDGSWLWNSAYVLVGFAVYNLVTSKLVSTGALAGDKKQIMDDWLKVGTMLVVSYVLGGGRVLDMNFVRNSAGTTP